MLVQHLVSMALGGGFRADELFDEVRSAYSYRALTREEFQWALDFVSRGGASLKAYPQYHRVVLGDDGVYRVPDRGIAMRHRLQVGTIVSDASMLVKWISGGTIGQIEEGFIARLNKGDHFVFAGRVLEYVRTQDMAAYVRKATKKTRHRAGLGAAARCRCPASWPTPRWPRSNRRARATSSSPSCRPRGRCSTRSSAVAPADAQDAAGRAASQSREGHHVFLYPFAGRHVHMGLASLLAWRLSRARAQHLQPERQRLRLRAARRRAAGCAQRTRSAACSTRPICWPT